MVNCGVFGIDSISSQLMLEQLARTYTFMEKSPLFEEDENEDSIKNILGWLKIAEDMARNFEISSALTRIENLRRKIDRGIGTRDLGQELRVLREDIAQGLKGQLIFRYSNAVKGVFENWKQNWEGVTARFPSARVDIISAVDLWALGHSTACVFHLMRVLEHGLRALASDVGRTFDTQNWQNIIDQIEAEIRTLGKSLPSGKEKSDRIRFLSNAAKEFMYFKDGWRNYVAHSSSHYDGDQARVVMDHVLQFMLVLAARLHEKTA